MSVTNAQLQALLSLTVSSATNGEAIPIPYGTAMVSGNLIWCPGLSETVLEIPVTDTSGNTHIIAYYSYSVSMAVGFCEGPAGILQIWGDTTVLYDNSGEYVDYEGPFVSTTLYSVGAIVSYNYEGVHNYQLIQPWSRDSLRSE